MKAPWRQELRGRAYLHSPFVSIIDIHQSRLLDRLPYYRPQLGTCISHVFRYTGVPSIQIAFLKLNADEASEDSEARPCAVRCKYCNNRSVPDAVTRIYVNIVPSGVNPALLTAHPLNELTTCFIYVFYGAGYFLS